MITDEYLKSLISDDVKEVKRLIVDKKFDFQELLYFRNLEDIRIVGLELDILEMAVLSKMASLKSIYFIDCNIENIGLLSPLDIDTLYLENCSVDSIEEINAILNIKNLYLEDMGTIDLDDIPVIRILENLSFTNTKLKNESKLIMMDRIIALDLVNTGISTIDMLIGSDTLKTLVIDENIYSNNREVVKYLKEKNVLVVNDMNQDVESYYGDI